MANIILYDVDSTIPNLPLMKLSSYHKKIGDKVVLTTTNSIDYSQYDYGYASVIFKKNIDKIKNFPFEIGGVGANNKKLPFEIEHLYPDYSLYPNNDFSIGYTTRGCIRNCDFCVVPDKEGLIKFNASIYEFLNPKYKKLMLLDNNIFAYKNYKKVFEEIIKSKKRVSFKQGLDFRLLTEEKTKNLLKLSYIGNYIFAYDNIEDKSIIERQMNKYRMYFHNWSLKFYVLVGFDSTIQDDIYRVLYLKEKKCYSYIMRHENFLNSEFKNFYIDFAAWVNQPFLFKKMSFEEFLKNRYKNQDRINFSLNVWKNHKPY